MPYLDAERDRVWLLPPSVESVVPEDHPVRFIADLLACLPQRRRDELGLDDAAGSTGRAAYPPVILASVWAYGFMRGIRSSRRLEGACQEQVPLWWLCGALRPDHNTLWRYWQAHRTAMRALLKQTVRIAYRAGLIDDTLQAIDGTKVVANASRHRSYRREALERLAQRTDEAIAELEAQGATGGESVSRLPEELAQAKERRAWLAREMAELEASGRSQRNLTDPDAQIMKLAQGGFAAGFNGQLVVSPGVEQADGYRGRWITGAEVVNEPDDHHQLVPMLEIAEEMLGARAALTLADGGYHSGANLEACAERGQAVLLAEGDARVRGEPFHKDAFTYDREGDTYSCPAGEVLRPAGVKRREGRVIAQVYQAGSVCRTCPFFGQCTTDSRKGRTLKIGSHEELLREHRALLATPEAQELYRHRKSLIELVFGIMKEQMGARRFLLRGIEGVRAEWFALAAAFNLRTLWQIWRRRSAAGRRALLAQAA